MRTKSLMSLLMAVVAALIFASSALAAPGDSPPFTNGRDILSGGTSWSAVFLFADAADTSDLLQLVAPPAAGLIFENNDLGTYPIGMTQTFSGYTTGQLLTFELHDLTAPNVNTWKTGSTSTNVSYDPITSYNPATSPAAIDATYGITLSAAAIASLNTLASNNGGNVLIVAFEDRPLATSDKDFNDLIFAFAPVFTAVPEPFSLLFLGMGLVSLVVARRRVKK